MCLSVPSAYVQALHKLISIRADGLLMPYTLTLHVHHPAVITSTWRLLPQTKLYDDRPQHFRFEMKCLLQEGQHVIGDAYDHVVIMFSDIVGFSTMSSTMSAVEVFLMLTNLYYSFDRLVDKFGVYKVETIGDGYMIAAGQCMVNHNSFVHVKKRTAP